MKNPLTWNNERRETFFLSIANTFNPFLLIYTSIIFFSVVDFVYILFFEKSQTVWFIHFLFLFAFDSYSSSLLIEFRKAKISIYRCRHVEKRNWNCTVASMFKSKMDVIFRAKHLNYFRWLNFNGKSLVEVMFLKVEKAAFICSGWLMYTTRHYLHFHLVKPQKHSLTHTQHHMAVFLLCVKSVGVCLPIRKRWTGLWRARQSKTSPLNSF